MKLEMVISMGIADGVFCFVVERFSPTTWGRSLSR